MKTASSSSESKAVKVRKVLPSMNVQMTMQHRLTAVCKQLAAISHLLRLSSPIRLCCLNRRGVDSPAPILNGNSTGMVSKLR